MEPEGFHETRMAQVPTPNPIAALFAIPQLNKANYPTKRQFLPVGGTPAEQSELPAGPIVHLATGVDEQIATIIGGITAIFNLL